jgi:putative ABC transport system ATP-binding protein
MTAPLLTASDLRHSYDGAEVLNVPHLQIERGEHHLLLGGSGSGKTTLLHILSGLLRPDAGTVQLGGRDLYALSESERDRARGQDVGLVFQQFHLVGALTAEQNLLLAPSMAGLPADARRAHELLDRLGIGGKANARPDALSQGQRQRVAVARALMNRPALLVADEPTSALDDQSAAATIDLLLAEAERENATLIVATHDGRITDRFAHRLDLGGR